MQQIDDELDEFWSDSDEEEARSCFYGSEICFRSNTKSAARLFNFNLFSMAGLAIRCVHNHMPVALMHSPFKNPGYWLPYVAVKKNHEQSIVNAMASAFFLKENGNKNADWKALHTKPDQCLFDKLVLHSLTRIQMPHGRFFDRSIYVGRFKDQHHCCKNTEHIKWIPIEKMFTVQPTIDGLYKEKSGKIKKTKTNRDSPATVAKMKSAKIEPGLKKTKSKKSLEPPKPVTKINVTDDEVQSIVNQCWGSENAAFAGLLTQISAIKCLQLREITFPSDFMFHFRESDEKVAFVCKIFNNSKLGRIYSDFYQHCYPSTTMSFTAFQNYFAKIGIRNHNDKRIARIFATFLADDCTNFNLTFFDFVYGLAMIEPENTGQSRIPYIWKYYKGYQNKKDPLEGEDLKLFKNDLQALTTIKLEALADFSKPLPYKTFENILQGKDNEQLLLKLFHFIMNIDSKSDNSVYNLITEKVPYPMKENRYGMCYRKEMQLTCDRCKGKQYTLARNIVQFRDNGSKPNRFTPIPIKGPECLLISPGKPKSFDLMGKLSTEIVFQPTSPANIVLNAIRNLHGITTMSAEKKKETITRVNQEITFEHISKICEEVQDILLSEPRLLKITSPCYVLGDIHGNIHDLLAFDRLFWPMSPTIMSANVLFLGDLVDRGDFSLEVVFYLFSQKLLAPNRFFFLRGNHEIRQVQKTFTFEKECNEKFGAHGQCVFDLINQTFDSFPFAALVNEKIYCAHGGIPLTTPLTGDLNSFTNLISDPRSEPTIWEILWNDPLNQEQIDELPGVCKGSKEDKTGFHTNYRRGTAYFWSPAATKNYLNQNNLSLIVRAHEMEEHGFKILHDGKVMTVFSCSKYCNSNNKAAILLIETCEASGKGAIRILQLQN